MSPVSEGQYVVTVELNGEAVLRSEGYAQNPTDALYRALERREEEHQQEQARTAE